MLPEETQPPAPAPSGGLTESERLDSYLRAKVLLRPENLSDQFDDFLLRRETTQPKEGDEKAGPPGAEEDSGWSSSCAEVTGKISLLLDTFGIDKSELVAARAREDALGGPHPRIDPHASLAKFKAARSSGKESGKKAKSRPRVLREQLTPSKDPPTSPGTPQDDAVVAGEARIASQKAAIAALRRTVKDKEDTINRLEVSILQMRSDFKSRNNALLLDKTGRDKQELEAQGKAFRDNLSKMTETHQREIRELRERGMQQSKRSQQLLDKIRKLAGEKEALLREKNEVAADSKSIAEQAEQLKIRLKIYKDRYNEESKKNEHILDVIEKSKSKIKSLGKSEKDLQEKLASMGKELAAVKSTLTKETSLRKKTQHQLKALEDQNKEMSASFKKFQERFQKHEAQREKMFGVIKHLKHINKELMSALLAERAANEETLSMDDVDNPSLLPQAVRLAKEEERPSKKGQTSSEKSEAEQEVPDAQQGNVDFYKNLKERYQEAKATYRSLLAKES